MIQNRKPIIATSCVALALTLSFTAFVGCKENNPEVPPSISSVSTDESGNSHIVIIDPTQTTLPIDFETVDETVYVTVAQVNLREGPSTDAKIATFANYGESMRRIKVSESWSLVKYNGGEYYVSSDCISTEDPSKTDLTFDPIDKTVTVMVEKANLRKLPSTEDSATIIAAVVEGDQLTAIGISSDKKWYKVTYKEQTLYISASVVGEEVEIEVADKTVYVLVDTLSIRKHPSADDSSTVVGFLKKNDEVKVIGVTKDGTWYQIKYTPEGGKEGTYYITANTKYVSETKPAAQ